MEKKSRNKKNNNLMYAAMGIALIAVLVNFLPDKNKKPDPKSVVSDNSIQNPVDNVVKVTLNEDGNMAIPLSDITEDATFYSYDNDGLNMEVIAIKASDGSIRTAFNTCQVCFGSGLAYYEQEGDKLVCQNCGNQFTADEVELIKGGCNPVPINEDVKDITDSEILISKAFLDENKVIFENWKR
ncbi:putative membrane protein DUF2318 [Mobilisporobacter senegalensis]|uniref:Putative membrane protein DUF2318 n=1 Tax=Mobilisporobacter senegalensis TaxID=1329262 RepID=A0A3N1XI25_9FIRM|nr:DUF2318 domain-containing protein [Mobilisporobacter senegalensis]ROR26400.1 putative membrane protein DUF2318 [Mobilisporobacter senegalensis]